MKTSKRKKNLSGAVTLYEDASPKSVRFLSRLHVRNELGEFIMATEEQVFDEAKLAVDYRYPTGCEFTCPDVSRMYFLCKLAGREREIFAVAFLNNQNQLLSYEEMFSGSLDAVEVHPREIAREALRLNASAVVLCHNHPSYTTEPSIADIKITHHIIMALDLVAVRVIDHIIVAGNETVSMAERGLTTL